MMGDIRINVSKSPQMRFKPKQKPSKFSKRPRDVSKFTVREIGENPSDSSTTERFKRKREQYEEGQEDSGNTRAKRHFSSQDKASSDRVSSLFLANPAIPSVAESNVKPVSEDVFSSESVKDLPISPYSINNLEKNLNISKLTTVQQRSFPVIMRGYDALIRSQTGSGKTFAYGLPIIEKLQSIRPELQRHDGIRALVIVPTRELALQTYECFVKLLKPFVRMVPGYMIGGEKKKSEKARLRKGLTVLVSTPGRMLDHVNTTECLDLKKVQFLVIDEADRLLEMGYEEKIASLVKTLNEQQYGDPDGEKQRFHHLDVDAPETSSGTEKAFRRQTLLLSATLTSSVERLAGLALRHPKFVDAATGGEDEETADLELIEKDLVIPQTLTQLFMLVPAKLRLVTLASIIVWKCRMTSERKILVFFATQDMVDFHSELFSSVLGTRSKQTVDIVEDSDIEDEYGLLHKKDANEEDKDDPSLVDIEFFKLHGSMSQKDRTEVFNTFRKAQSGVLLCTDVAARGLDLPQVDWIVQYTAPSTVADYVHRVGRTARGGTDGSALILLAPSEVGFIAQLEQRRIKIAEQGMAEALKQLVPTMAMTDPSLNRMKRGAFEHAATQLQVRFEEAVTARRDLHDLACKGYISFVRFYSSYPIESREVFNFKAVHLGHYAKSFALRDPPSKIGGIGRKQWLDKQKSKSHHEDSRRPRGGPGSSRGIAGGKGTGRPQPPSNPFSFHAGQKMTKMLAASEFSSGLPPPTKKAKGMKRFN